jgi:Family of unknown function (DUF6152)
MAREAHMRRIVSAFFATFVLLTVTPPLFAHHSFAAEFDGNKPVILRGPVRKVEWRNPHIWVYLDVREADGKLTPWQCEGGAPNALTRQGWTRNTFTLNEDIIVEGWQAKNGTNTCNARTWKLGDGRVVLAGSSNEAAGQSVK